MTQVRLLVPAALAQPAAETPEPAKPKLTKAPKLVTFVEAVYPPEEKAAGRQASVVLAVGIGADGKVLEAAVSTSAGVAFDAAALAAVKQFVFEPAEFDGNPAPVRILYKYDFVIRQEAKTTADFSGVVRNRKTKKPLPGIRITAAGAGAVTDAEGRFSLLDLPPGKQVVTLEGEGITALRTEEVLEAGKRVDVDYAVSPEEKVDPADKDDLEIVVVAPPLQKAIASIEIAADQGRKVPGTQGDVLKVVENMPGVARSAAGSGQLVVWGAAPQDTRIYVDGVRIPVLYHTSGLRSVVAGDLVRAIELVPGGYGAAYGRGLGGIVRVDLAPLDGQGVHGSVGADVIDASAAVRAHLGKGVRVALAGRTSYLDKSLAAASDEDVGDFFPIPKYNDAQLRLGYEISKRERVELSGLYSSDKVTRTVTSSDPAFIKRDLRDLDFYRVWLRYVRDLDDGSTISVVPFFGQDGSRLTNQFGGPATSLDVTSSLYGFRGSWRGRLSRHLTLNLGLDAEVVASRLQRAGSLNVPAREGDVRVFGQLPPDAINFDTWQTVVGSLAPYAELDLALFGGALHIVPGLRVEPYFVSTSRRTPAEGLAPAIGLFTQDTAVQPRITVRWAPAARVALQGSIGAYRQPPQAEDLSAVFGNPTLSLSQATHYVLGLSLRLTEKLTGEITGFYATSSELASRSPLSSPLQGEALVPLGTGRTTGGQILLRREMTARLFGWVSYSFLRAERTDPVPAMPAACAPPTVCPGAAFATGPWRLFDFDQTHLLTAVASYNFGWGVEAGLRVRYATGFPRTEVVGAYFDARRDAYQPRFGARNGIRLPAFVQVDARLAKKLKLGRQNELEVYLDLQNVTDRSNAEEFVYTSDYSRRGTISGLPILPVLGARLTW